MRRVVLAFLLVFASVPVPSSVHAQNEPVVQITEVHPRPASGEREFIELWNPGPEPVDITGWNLTDGTNTFTFEAWTVPPNGRVVVWGGGNASGLGPVWKANVWNNGGDTVRLQGPAGATVDEMSYGTTDVPAPTEGQSLHWNHGWFEGGPSPGQGPDHDDGGMAATVEDVPPELEWLDVPNSVRTGQVVEVRFRIADGNGDPVQWSVTADGASVASGATSEATIAATAPDAAGAWNWTVTAESTVHEASWSRELAVFAGAFQVQLPESGIRFPGLAPGASGLETDAPFRIVNVLDQSATPHVDVSPLVGQGTTIPVDGNLVLRVQAGGADPIEVRYAGPLQPLPALAAGDAYEVWLVLLTVPTPLPAGAYAGSFTVVE